MRIRILLLAACLFPLGVLARPLTPDDVYRWQYLTEPRISPDGRWVAYTLSVPARRAHGVRDLSGEYHGLSRPSFRVDRARRYDEWYDRFLKAN